MQIFYHQAISNSFRAFLSFAEERQCLLKRVQFTSEIGLDQMTRTSKILWLISGKETYYLRYRIQELFYHSPGQYTVVSLHRQQM